MSEPKPIVIAGAGIGGLTLGLALLQRGIAVRIHEQAPSLSDVGAGLQFSANGTRCLFSLGLENALQRVATAPEGKEVRLWNTGQRWKLFDLGAESRTAFGFPYLMIHRGDLHRILLEAVRQADPQAIRAGSRCIGFTQNGNGVTIDLEDGSQVHGAALVGADGVHSIVRGLLFGQEAPQFTGCLAWRGLIQVDQLPKGFLRPVGVNWIGPGAHVVTYPLRGGQLMNFVGIVERDDWQLESWTEPGSAEECARDFKGWHADVHTMIERIKQPYKWALMGREPLNAWSQDRVTLLGDAAHPTLPFLAQGANMAIEDGIVLARCIEAFGSSLPEAFKRYENLRIERTSRIVRGSAENARRFHNPALAQASSAQRYVDEEWSEAKVRARYNWLFEYDALGVPLGAPQTNATTSQTP